MRAGIAVKHMSSAEPTEKPMGGVRAAPLSKARAGDNDTARETTTAVQPGLNMDACACCVSQLRS